MLQSRMFVGSSRQSHQFARPFQPYRRIRVAQVVLTVLRRRAARHEIIPARRASQPVFRLLTFQLPTAFANSRRIDDPNRIVVPSDPPGAENEGSSPSATTRPTPGRNFFAMCTSNFIQLKTSQNQHIRKNTGGVGQSGGSTFVRPSLFQLSTTDYKLSAIDYQLAFANFPRISTSIFVGLNPEQNQHLPKIGGGGRRLLIRPRGIIALGEEGTCQHGTMPSGRASLALAKLRSP